jgi:hypothetical protein
VTEGSDGDPTAIYTGTSVSAAVASSIAAVVWHLRPDLTPRQVMRIVTRSGKLLPFKADAYSWKDFWPLSHLVKAPHVRRLSLCRAIERACGPDGTACPALKSLPACKEFEEMGSADLSVLLPPSPPSPPPFTVILSSSPVHLPSPCDPDALFWGALGPDALCPLEMLPDRTGRRWVIPQPQSDPCPGCTLVPEPPADSRLGALAPVKAAESYILIPEISSEWTAAQLQGDPVLNIDCYDAGSLRTERMSYPIPLSDLLSNRHLRISINRKLDRCSASLDFKVKRGGSELSIQNPVYVAP